MNFQGTFEQINSEMYIDNNTSHTRVYLLINPTKLKEPGNLHIANETYAFEKHDRESSRAKGSTCN